MALVKVIILIEYIDNKDGLTKNSEWKALSDSIKYKGHKTILAESLYTSLCFDNDSCNTLNSDFRPKHYDSSVLKLPTVDDIENELLRQTNLSWLDRLQSITQSSTNHHEFIATVRNNDKQKKIVLGQRFGSLKASIR